LEAAVLALGWAERVQVVRGRAEDVGRLPIWRASQQAVVARSFGVPAVVAECASPLLRAGGYLVVSEPPAPQARSGVEIGHPDRWPAEALAELGLRPVHFHQADFGYQVLAQVGECPDRFPRRTGVPAKRPLF
jgi:16S rRNA (guanine527-N7)-methyltransferase